MKKLSICLLAALGIALFAATAAVFAQSSSPTTQTGNATQEMQTPGLSAAHNSLPIGSKARIRSLSNGREIEVTITERIPTSTRRIIDLSPSAAMALELGFGGPVIVWPLTTVAVVPKPEPMPKPQMPLLSPSQSQKFAVVIGNQDYTKFGRLTKTRTDANDVDAALRSIGFTVNKVLDGNLQQMQAALTWLRNRLGESEDNAYGFFYYSGHGAQDRNGESYLIPADADIPSENYVGTRALALKTIHEEMSSAGNQLNIIVLDACRDYPAAWGGKSISKGLGRITYRLVNSLIVYATTPGEVAVEDSTGRHSLFTENLLKYLTSSDLHVNEMFRRVSADVVKASRERQIPQINGQYFGTAILNPAGQPPPIVTPAPRPAPTPQPAPAPIVQPVTPPVNPPPPPTPLPSVSLYDQLVKATGTVTITVTQNAELPRETVISRTSAITLRGDTSGRTVLGNGSNSIKIERGVTLILENITLRGVGINVNEGGTLVMNNAATITGCTSSGVYVYGTFNMSGGSITNNGDSGVLVREGRFTMSGGTISNNTSDIGGGVYVYNGSFYMQGGTIAGNRASTHGGGVFVLRGTFRMTGGTIYGSNGGSNANIAGGLGKGHALYDDSGSRMIRAHGSTIRQYD